ncbi:Crp/Fnr family transcriptional regulator [Methylocystis sp. IM2]|uniref:Crp/Fnr family transcriptional regulator n=1 Tax=Methylocystis sp. IM2 TaxID=3136563 RepID=UPI0030F8E172
MFPELPSVRFRRHPFFAGLDPARAEAFGRQCVRKRYDEGELVLDFEDPSEDVYFIVGGDVRVLVRTAAGKEMILGDFGPGKFFGEMAAIDGAKRSANVTALTNAEILLVPPGVFREIVLHAPEITERLLRLLTARVRELNIRLFERSVLDLRHRLYSELLRMSAPRKGHDGQSIISPPPFQHDLAARIGCRREQVSRELGAMIEEGTAEKIRGGLVLLRPALLEKRVRDAMNEAE